MPPVPTSLLIIFLAGLLLFRSHDIRLVLLLAAAAMFGLRATQPESADHRWDLFGDYFLEFAKGLTNPASVVPICTAMGFAYVCKQTRCDVHLVHLLVAPLRYINVLLIPGGIAVAFLVNSAIVSQTSTVAVVGPVLIPLLLAAGISRRNAGALLLLGGSMGGELLNPAAVEVSAIKMLTKQEAITVVHRILPYNLIASGTALLVFWLLSFHWQRRDAAAPDTILATATHTPGSLAAAMDLAAADSQNLPRLNIAKALVPLVPILLLLLLKPNIPLPAAFRSTDTNKLGEQASIAAAMIIGVTVAALVSRGKLNGIVTAFFEGAGFTFIHVIPVIAGATMFAEGVRLNGLIDRMSLALQDAPAVLNVAAVAIAWLMAMVTGTAVGTAPLVINMMVPLAMPTPGPAAIHAGSGIGALCAVAAQFGRTSSPVAPVVIMCAALSRDRPIVLVWRVLAPLAAGAVALLIAGAVW